MQTAPAFCPNHGLFASPFPLVPGGGVLGCTASCPRCHLNVPVLNTTMDEAGAIRAFLQHAGFSVEVISKVKVIARKVAAGEMSPEEARNRAKEIEPKAARIFDFSGWSEGNRALVLVAAISAGGMIGAATIDFASNAINAPSVSQPTKPMDVSSSGNSHSRNGSHAAGPKFAKPPPQKSSGSRAQRRKEARMSRRKLNR